MQRKSKYILGIIVLLSIFLVVYLAYPLLLKTGGGNQSRVVLGTYNLPEVQISGALDNDLAERGECDRRCQAECAGQDDFPENQIPHGITLSSRSYYRR